MISAYNPQVYQEKPIQYNYKTDGVNRLLQLKNSLYEQNYEYIKGLKSDTLGIRFINENGNREIKNIQENVNNFFKTHDINKYDVGDAAIANEFTNQFKSLESDRSLQELYRIDKSLQDDLSMVNNLRTAKDRENKGYSTKNHELFQYQLEEYSKLDKATAVGKGAEAFRYTPYTNVFPEYKSILSMIPIKEYDVMDKNGNLHRIKGRDPLDIQKAFNEGLSESARKQLAIKGQLEVRRALRSGATTEQIYKDIILPRTSPILLSKSNQLQVLNTELAAAQLGGDPKKEQEAQSKIDQIKTQINDIKNATDMSFISKMGQDQFINMYGQISANHQIEHLSNAFGQLNDTMNMAHMALKSKEAMFQTRLSFDSKVHAQRMELEKMKIAQKERELSGSSISDDSGVPDIPATSNASDILQYQQFDKFHTEIGANAAEIYKDHAHMVKLTDDSKLANNPNIYARAFHDFIHDNAVVNKNYSPEEKARIFQILIEDIKAGNYDGATDLKQKIYASLKPSYDYHDMYKRQWNKSVSQLNNELGLKSSSILNKAEFETLKRNGSTSLGSYDDYKAAISKKTQENIDINYTVTTPVSENPRFLPTGLPKLKKEQVANKFYKDMSNIQNLISTEPVTNKKGLDSDAVQVTNLSKSDLIKSIKTTPTGYWITFDDAVTTTEGEDGDDKVKTKSQVANKFITLKDGQLIPIDQGPKFIPYPNESRDKYLHNVTVANATPLNPVKFNYKGYTLTMYNDGGLQYKSNIPNPNNPQETLDLTTSLLVSADPLKLFRDFVDALKK